MVPVGGALVTAPARDGWLAAAVAHAYPGRASASPLVDLLVTLLHWGADGWRRELGGREGQYGRLQAALERAAAAVGERVLVTPGNPISLAVTVDGLVAAAAAAAAATRGGDEGATAGSGKQDAAAQHEQQQQQQQQRQLDVTYFGSMLFSRGVSGTRVLAPGKHATVGGVAFADYGCHCGDSPHAYVTAAAALGAGPADAEDFCGRFVKAYREFEKKAAAAGAKGTRQHEQAVVAEV